MLEFGETSCDPSPPSPFHSLTLSLSLFLKFSIFQTFYQFSLLSSFFPLFLFFRSLSVSLSLFFFLSFLPFCLLKVFTANILSLSFTLKLPKFSGLGQNKHLTFEKIIPCGHPLAHAISHPSWFDTCLFSVKFYQKILFGYNFYYQKIFQKF